MVPLELLPTARALPPEKAILIERQRYREIHLDLLAGAPRDPVVPVITAIVPLFSLSAAIGLADNLIGLVIVYVGSTMSMMAAYFDSIPHALEEAARVDGCSVFGSFTKIVLRNSLPGILSTAIFGFHLAWNDYLVALVFIRSANIFTLPIGLHTSSSRTRLTGAR
jgi:ABC-type glycerol-3-phosphate transport system permease component